MKLLLDSHALVWFVSAPEEMPRPTVETIADSAGEAYFSAASVWELALKKAKGKIEIEDGFIDTLEANGLVPLAVSPQHALLSSSLPLLHKDPFDRMLVAQAQLEGLTVVTRDDAIRRYGVAVLPA